MGLDEPLDAPLHRAQHDRHLFHEMNTQHASRLDAFMEDLVQRNPHEVEFHQAVREVAASVVPFVDEHPNYRDAQILERMTEPDRVVIFRVTWEDDNGKFCACLLYTSPSPRDQRGARMPSSA